MRANSAAIADATVKAVGGSFVTHLVSITVQFVLVEALPFFFYQCLTRRAQHGDRFSAHGDTMIKGPIAAEMEALLTAAFAPSKLAVINDSAKHHGHSGDDGSGESHFTIEIESAAFASQSRVSRQRMVNKALGDIPGQRVHALAIKASAPGE
jgi:BolA family transcriptional regulator, general stress-responsive regulator